MQQIKAFSSQATFPQSLQESVHNQGQMPSSFPLGVCEEEGELDDEEDSLAPPPEWAPIRTMPARPNVDSVFNAAPTRIPRHFQPQPKQQLMLPHPMQPQLDQPPHMDRLMPNQPLPCGMQPQSWKPQQEPPLRPEPQNVRYQTNKQPQLGLQSERMQHPGSSPSAEWDDDDLGSSGKIDHFRARTLPVNVNQHSDSPASLPRQMSHQDAFCAPVQGNTPQNTQMTGVPADELDMGPAIAWHRMRTMPAPPSQDLRPGGFSAGFPERHRDDNWKRAAGGGCNMNNMVPVMPLMVIPVPIPEQQGTTQGEVSAQFVARSLEQAAPEFYED